MKVNLYVFLVFASLFTLFLSSYREGPAYWGGIDGAGATGSSLGCSNGGGCHGATSSNNVVIELDSVGIPVQSYYPGLTYTVKISATNSTGATLSHFGFQMASVLLSGAGTSTAAQGGTWDSITLPASVKYTIAGPMTCQVCSGWPIPIVEHSTAIPATTGTGANGTTYVESINWTAPPQGTGTVLLYGVLNAVNYDGGVRGDYAQVALADTITEAIPATTHTGINALSAYISDFTVYPTLMNDNVTVAFDLKQASAVRVELLSMQGQVVKTLVSQEQIAAGIFRQSYNVNELSAGVYLCRLQIGGAWAVSKVVKE
jgi:hypothetical protein